MHIAMKATRLRGVLNNHNKSRTIIPNTAGNGLQPQAPQYKAPASIFKEAVSTYAAAKEPCVDSEATTTTRTKLQKRTSFR